MLALVLALNRGILKKPRKSGVERVKGIEPSSQAWEAHILPLNHTRTEKSDGQKVIAEDRGRNGGVGPMNHA